MNGMSRVVDSQGDVGYDAGKVGECLKRRVDPEYVSSRQGAANQQLNYLTGEVAINIVNDIFGYDGWSDEIRSVTDVESTKGNDGKWTVSCSVVVRIHLRRENVSREDIGHGTGINASKLLALEKAQKEGATDGFKRACRKFGPATGNCLYNKRYNEMVGKFKRSGGRVNEFGDEDLYRIGQGRISEYFAVTKKRKLGDGNHGRW